MSRVDKILNFWFGREDEADYGKYRTFWFTKKPDFDREIITTFKADYEQAAAGELDHWMESPYSCLALILLLDQFSRNMFRGTPQTFATDPQACSVAQHTIAKGFDQQLLVVQRLFVYLPFQHSEELDHQRQSVDLFRQIGEETEIAEAMSYAVRHLEIIECFGRFPHRNEILGRATTIEEAEFLKQPDSSF